MLPELPALGPWHPHTYGIMLAIAFWLGSAWLWRESHRNGWDENKVTSLLLVLLLVSVAGARGMFVLTHWQDYARDPLGAVRIWEGGLTLYGGILPVGIWYCRRAGLPVWRVADALAAPVALGMALGRVGCFLNGCCFGKPTSLPWGVHFPPRAYGSIQFPGLALHPSQLYFTGAELGIMGLLLALRGRLRRPGQLWWLFVMLDSATRFLIDFTRYYEPSAFLAPGIEISQAISVGLFLVGAAMFWITGRTAEKAPAPAEHAAG